MEAMEAEIATVLISSMNSDEATRVNAEHALTQGSTREGFGLGLTRVALNQSFPYGTRQLAAVVLKKYVKEHWQEGEGRFIPPQTSEQEKQAIRELLPRGLSDPIPKIRTATGMAIATICAWDWPHQWPALTGILLGAIRERRSEDEVVGALRCLAMIAGDMEESQVPEVVPFLFPELLSIVAADAATYGLALKRRALAVLHSCLLTLGMMSGAKQRAVRDLMAPLLPPWLEVFSAALAAPPRADDPSQCGFVLEVLRCLAQVVQYFSKTAGESLMVPLGRAAMLFHGIAPGYRAAHVGPDADADAADAAQDSDGEDLNLEAVVSQLLELVMTLVEHSRLSSVLANGLNDTVYQAIGYMCMTVEQEEAWESDPNQYVADEDDDMVTVRATCGMLLDELADRFEGAILVALASAVERRLGESETARAAGDPTWWKIREATLLAVGTLNDFIVESEAAAREEGATPPPFSAALFLQSVMDADLAAGAEKFLPPFLRGRALWVAARLAPGAPPAAAGAVLHASLAALAPGAAAPLRVGACRALAQYVPMAPKDVLQPFLGPIYQGLGTLLGEDVAADGNGGNNDNGTPEETLHLVLEAMLVVVKSDDAAAAAWSGALAPATLRVWAEKVTDPLLAADARDVLEALASVPACLPSLHQLAVPTLAGVIATPEAQPPMLVESTLDLLCVLLRPAVTGGAEARTAHAGCFKHVVALACNSDDVGVLQSAADCLRAFLRSGGDESLSWGMDGNGDGDGGDGGRVLRAYLDAAARLLSPSLEDGAAVFAAPLLGQMLRRLPTHMAPLLPEVVSAVVNRVHSARQPNLIAALLSIFARLAHADANALVSLLAGMPAPATASSSSSSGAGGGGSGAGGSAGSGTDGVPPATNALELVMRAWTSFQPDVQGAFDIKLTTSALALLLQTGNPALGTVGVKGELVNRGGSGGGSVPRTRSRAKAAGPDVYTVVPLPGKILELLADALLEAKEAEEAAAGGGGGGGEDEWESDDDGDGDDDEDEYGVGGGGEFGRGGRGMLGDDLLERLLNKGIDEVEDDDADEAEDPIAGIDTVAYLGDRLQALHGAGQLAPLANGLNQRRQKALMTLLQ